ncbi:hypothetical protein MPER_03898 [Moniliophthora perniciosa FA553]|nr:hypothetical protein MPER_03898 [Moniliophthora perniciosa FA553]
MDFPHRPWKVPNYRANLAAWIAMLLRKLAKILATVNAVWIILTCIFQFSGFFDRCYCNSSVLGRGVEKAFDVMDPSDDVPAMQAAWIGGVVLASGTAFLFLLFVNTMIDPPLPDE